MTGLKACALRSGSSGNAIFVGNGRTRLLVDAGVCCRSIEQSLEAIGESASGLDGLLVTHEHTDHISGAGALMRRYKIPVYVSAPTWRAMRDLAAPVAESQVRLIESGKPFVVGNLQVTSFPTPHDAADPVGYRIENGQGAGVAIMTDTGHFSDRLLHALAGCRAIFIEANYDQAMLVAGTYPAMLKERILGRFGHLSNDDCAEAVCHLLGTGTRSFILSHISKDNNYPELALLTVGSRLAADGAIPGKDLQLAVAQRFAVSEPFCF